MKMTLENKIEVIRGVNYKPSIDLRTSSDADSIALLRANNIKNGCIAFDDVQYVSKSKVKIEQLLRKGDILVCASSGSKQLVGKAALITRDIRATFGAFCCVIRPISISPCFLSNYFSSSAYRVAIEEACSGSNINNLKPKNFYDLQIPNYSLDEQAEISEKLSKARSLIERCQSLNIYLDELVKSRFVETFGDPCDVKSGKFPMEEIGSFCELTIGPFGSALHKEDYIDGGHPVINPSHIVSGRIVPNTKLTVGESKFASMKPYHLHKGDVVLGRRGEIGRCAVVTDEGLLCGTGSMILRPKKSLCRSDYLQRVVSFPAFAAALGREAVGVTMKNLNIKIVGNSSVVLPPLSLQQEFASFVAQVDKLKFDLGICLFVLKEEFFRLIG